VKLYLYGIVDSSNQIEEAIYGLRGCGVYSIPYRDIGVVVSEMGQATQGLTEGGVLEHEAVVEKLMADFTVLPMRFRTLVDGRDNLLAMMQSYYRDFKGNLERLRNKSEFGVKVIWPADKVKENIVNRLRSDQTEASGPRRSAGTRFMKEKFERYKIDEEFQTKADQFIKAMDMFLGKFAVEKRLEKLKTEKLLLDAAYLVEKSQACDFREAFWHIKSAHPGFKFLLSGPWPAYNFVGLSKHDPARDAEQANLFAEVARSQALVGAGSV